MVGYAHRCASTPTGGASRTTSRRPGTAPDRPPAQAATPRPAVTALQTYCDEYDTAMQLAKGFRLDAATKLSDIYDQISYEPGHQNNPDQWATVGDYVRGLYAVPDEMGRHTRGRLDGMDERMKKARQDLRAAGSGSGVPDSHARQGTPAAGHAALYLGSDMRRCA